MHILIMIRLFILLSFVCLSASAADDIADAKVAFANLVQYQKTDDIRSLDLFAKQCLITFTIIDGTTEQIAVVPPEVFREALKKGIAQKKGSNGEYEDIKYSSDGSTVKVTATIHYTDSDKRGPFSATYARDIDDGVMRIEKFKVTIFTHVKTP